MDTLALRDAHSVLQVSGMSTGTSMEWAHKVEIPEKEMGWAGRANQGISRVNGGTLVRSSTSLRPGYHAMPLFECQIDSKVVYHRTPARFHHTCM